ncbi:LysR substrate-binding domain-containing protein [Microbulbifer bruguierae]|uniref:LysR substrate-binding domain-containing protein n=1 Tax=Microbulbifer bruguierae TaxID=3029061 RepID=A0ABY8NGE5_9GAMM|nr:LysR substrate-binding domain-containing protein [Microbulbifer bruguierae]WGL17755.1 LysR substrate-binding domain-containing protein [Microbulbifer bruguierae]
MSALLQPQDFDPASARFTVHIAATDYALRAVVLPLLPALRQQAPNLRVAVRVLQQDQLAAQFERGEVDLALLMPESVAPNLHSRRLFDERYICVLRSGHPDAHCEQISMERFCALDHALVSLVGDPFHGVTDRTLAELGHRRHVAVSLPSFLALLELLRNSDLISLLPEKLLEGVEGLTQVEPPIAVPGFTKVAAWHERTHRDPGQAWVRQILFERFCDSD